MKITFSHFIPLEDELRSLGSTSIETTSFNPSPYLMFGKDTAQQYAEIEVPTLTTSSMVTDLPICTDFPYQAEDGILGSFNNIYTLTTGESITFSHSFNMPKPLWFNNIQASLLPDQMAYLYQNVVTGNLVHIGPGRPMQSDWTTDRNNVAWGDQVTTGIPLLVATMPAIRKKEGDLVKLRCSTICEGELTTEHYLTPEGMIDGSAYHTGSFSRLAPWPNRCEVNMDSVKNRIYTNSSHTVF